MVRMWVVVEVVEGGIVIVMVIVSGGSVLRCWGYTKGELEADMTVRVNVLVLVLVMVGGMVVESMRITGFPGCIE